MSLVWNWPQIVWLGLAAASLVIAIAKHGEPRKPMNAWDTIIGILMVAPLLYFGGFWTGATP